MSNDLVIKGIPQVIADTDEDSLDTSPLEPVKEQTITQDDSVTDDSLPEESSSEEETE